MKQKHEKLAWYAFLVALLGVAAATLFVEVGVHAYEKGNNDANHDPARTEHDEHADDEAVAADASCRSAKKTVYLTVSDDAIEPQSLTANLCDELIIRNSSHHKVEMAVGPHEHHSYYPGLEEKVTAAGSEISVVLKTKGTFEVHNHFNEAAQAELIVK